MRRRVWTALASVSMAGFVYYLAATLDGFIADEDDGLDWLTGYQGEAAMDATADVREAMRAFDESVGALAMGSATYEWMARHVTEWPYGERPTYVFTSRGRLDPIEGANLRWVSGNPAPLADEMREAAGERDFWIVGGGELTVAFAEAGLLDEVIVTVVPVALGAGKPLFGRPLGRQLTLTGCRPFATGMVELTYAVS
jgi:dihydrofolate reductase